MRFNPAAMRANFDEWEREALLKAVHQSDCPMGNFASCHLEAVLLGWLVGITVEFASVIDRSLEWLDRAIADDEDFGTNRDFHRETLLWAKAIGLWMRDSTNDVDAWSKTSLFAKSAMADPALCSKAQLKTLALDDYMAQCFQAGAYAEAIEEFEKYHGVKALSLKKTLKPRELAYALSLQRTRPQFDEGALFEAGKKMLQSNMDENWLGAGELKRAATWLKIVYWHHDQSLTPLQTILKAYDHMPSVSALPRPTR